MTDAPPTLLPARRDTTRRLVEHLRHPLHRNGYALIASTFATSGLGAIFWAIAAHRYSSHDVGINASLISTMMFLTNLASLNFSDVLNRFVPVGGPKSARLVWGSYAIALALAGVSSTVFIFGLGIWTPWLRDTLHGPLLGAFYIIATMLWAVFVLQDAVLVGLRKATYVLVENFAFGIVKIVLLIIFAAAFPATGIFVSWTIPLLAVVLAVNVLVFARLLPQHHADESTTVEDVDKRDVGKFLVADYIAQMLWTATIALMPVLVLNTEGASQSAYVYLAWTIAYTLYLVSRNMGMALTTEGARDPARLHEHTRAALWSAARIVVPGALLLAAGAPFFLRLFGPEYSTHGTMLLRILALSAIPALVPLTFISVARVQRRLLAMAVVTALTTVPVLALTPPFIHLFGITGVGIAWLVVQAAVAVALLLGEMRPHIAGASGASGASGAGGAGAAPARAAAVPAETLVPSVPARRARRREKKAVVEVEREPRRVVFLRAITRLVGTSVGVLAVAWPVVTIGGALALWTDALIRLNPDAMGALGLLSAAPVTYFVALGLVVVGMGIALARGARTPVVLAHAAVFILIVHATPAITYGTLRYAWAWRHIGIVELMMRRHQLVPSSPVLPIYQSFPGFFATATTLTESGGLRNALSFASWAPPVFEMLDTLALVVLLRSFTTDRRRIALAVWLFLIANWVGQDYFAPQAFAFFLYLVVLTLVFRWFRRPALAGRFSRGWFAAPEDELEGARPADPAARKVVALVLLVLMLGIASSHPLTPVILTVALFGLMFSRVLTVRWPAIAMAVVTVGWMVSGGYQYVFETGTGLIAQFGQIGSNVDSNLSNVGKLSAAQQLVATMGRGVVVAMAVLAIAGFLRRLTAGHLDWDVIVLCVAPASVFVGGSYGGEAVFRVYLFALPFAAFYAAGAFYKSARSRTTWRTGVAVVAVSAVLVTGFMFGYYGKEQWFRFTPSEVRAAELVYSTAPDNSMLVTGTLTFPTDFSHQERFTTTAIANEPEASMNSVLRDPEQVLHDWLDDGAFARTYLIITRTQIAEAENTGLMPHGSLQRIVRILASSPRFEILYYDKDAIVLTLPDQTRPQQ